MTNNFIENLLEFDTMSDNRIRLKVIHRALKRLCPTEPGGHVARRQFTLA